ncbi:hypothetical protein J1N35_020373 [Gossypium stocksii]|uniref:Uncharacterized protein n=1 Tax=Gossypium stocksii TaxID=47602 RepID=A0A9D3VDQ3_9ROSI|nr:hypothetical protein J1N35_020373 [Gossypium stocksii]
MRWNCCKGFQRYSINITSHDISFRRLKFLIATRSRNPSTHTLSLQDIPDVEVESTTIALFAFRSKGLNHTFLVFRSSLEKSPPLSSVIIVA